MAVPVVETTQTSGSSTNVTTCTVTMPSGVASGDLLIVVLSISANRTITAPSGWTEITNNLDGASISRGATYRRISDGSEGSSQNWTLSASANFNASALRISGVDGTTPINVSTTDGSANNSVSPSVTTTVADCLILRVFSMGRDRSFTEPGSHTKRSDALGPGVACDHATATISQASAGSTGTATWTVGGGTADRTLHIVLGIAPTAGGGGVRSPLIRGDLTYPAVLTGGRLILA